MNMATGVQWLALLLQGRNAPISGFISVNLAFFSVLALSQTSCHPTACQLVKCYQPVTDFYICVLVLCLFPGVPCVLPTVGSDELFQSKCGRSRCWTMAHWIKYSHEEVASELLSIVSVSALQQQPGLKFCGKVVVGNKNANFIHNCDSGAAHYCTCCIS